MKQVLISQADMADFDQRMAHVAEHLDHFLELYTTWLREYSASPSLALMKMFYVMKEIGQGDDVSQGQAELLTLAIHWLVTCEKGK